MKVLAYLLASSAALLVMSSGLFAVPYVFAGRVLPGVHITTTSFSGISERDLPSVLAQYERELEAKTVHLKLKDTVVERTISELGVKLDRSATSQSLRALPWWDTLTGNGEPRLVVTSDARVLNAAVTESFASEITAPENATLRLTATGIFETVPSRSGEGVDLITFEHDLLRRVYDNDFARPIELVIVSTAPSILDNEVASAREYANRLLAQGLELIYQDRTYEMKPFTVTRLMTFIEQADPQDPANHILGVTFADAALREYLENTVRADINQPAIDARFAITSSNPEAPENMARVTQFALPQQGRELNFDASMLAINQALAEQGFRATLVVDTTEPAVAAVADIEALGIKELIATGTSDFSGSPANRIHNIEVGTTRYHGLLIPSGEEFSFNEFLGPVDGAHGFKPELVIKQNVTKPEFGGGLCQVSTTLFRAAVYGGLTVTDRRNHAYAVRYYGKPGFDATIYPPYTDLRFTNNTPGYILIQARIEGRKLTFEFWGTADGRQVEVDGPHTYDHQPDGSVKATLTQRVLRDGQVIHEQEFYSRYKSPNLFPKVLQEDDPQRVSLPSPTPSVQPTPTLKPSPTPKPTKTPTAPSG